MTNPKVHLNVIDVNVKMNHDGSFWGENEFSSMEAIKKGNYFLCLDFMVNQKKLPLRHPRLI